MERGVLLLILIVATKNSEHTVGVVQVVGEQVTVERVIADGQFVIGLAQHPSNALRIGR